MAEPGEGEVQFSTERTDVGSFVFWVVAFTAITFDIIFDAYFTMIECVEGAVGKFRI